MSRRVPLTVRVSTKFRDVDITKDCHNLQFKSSIPGGYASATFTVSRSLRIQPGELGYYARVYIYDGRSGEVVWEGRLEDPGRSAGDTGETWNITAIGPKAHASDRWFPIVYIDSTLERWKRSKYSVKKALTETAEFDDDQPALQIRAEENTNLPTSWSGDWIYRQLLYCGQRLGRVRATISSGGVNTNMLNSIVTRTGGGALDMSLSLTSDTSAQTLAANTGSAGWAQTSDVVSLRMDRINVALTGAPDTIWTQFYDISVQAKRKDVNGDDITDPAAYAVNNVDTADIVRDLLGRVLTRYDGVNARITTSGADVEQFAYIDGTTAEAILNDLLVIDPGFYWAAWETNAETGKYRFEYRPWPSTIRYEADVTDGFESPASADELYNAVRVRFRDAMGRIRTVRRTQTVPELSDAGVTREAYIDVSDEAGGFGNALLVGDNFLLEHRFSPNAGTLKIARPIVDNVTGRRVMPWEIKPGNVIRVRGVQPVIDSLNPGTRNGVTVFRIIATEFDQASSSCTLELDSYQRTIQRMVSQGRNPRLRNSVDRRR